MIALPPEMDDSVLAHLDDVRRDSPDRSTKTAAALVSPDGGTILLAIHNAIPEGVADLPERHERPGKYDFFEHSERRAIYACAADGIATRGTTMYASHFPCADCARAIIESKVAGLVVNGALLDVGLVARFFDSMTTAATMLAERGVHVRVAFPTEPSVSVPPPGAGWPRIIPRSGDAIADACGAFGRPRAADYIDDKGRFVTAFMGDGELAFVRGEPNGSLSWGLFGDGVKFGAGDAAAFRDAIGARPRLALDVSIPGPRR